MTALWISLAGVVILLLAWRLRKASGKLERILREERERTEQDSATQGHLSDVEVEERSRRR